MHTIHYKNPITQEMFKISVKKEYTGILGTTVLDQISTAKLQVIKESEYNPISDVMVIEIAHPTDDSIVIGTLETVNIYDEANPKPSN